MDGMTESTVLPQLKGAIQFLEKRLEAEGEDAKVYCSVMKKFLKEAVEELESN